MKIEIVPAKEDAFQECDGKEVYQKMQFRKLKLTAGSKDKM